MSISIVAICGTVRPANYTRKALDVVVDELRTRTDVETRPIYLEEVDLPYPGLGAGDGSTAAFREAVAGATGVILATPEYHGSFSGVLKVAIENLGFPSVLAGKPVSLLGVAAGQIGAVKSIGHLTNVCSHVGAIVLPGPVSVANVQKVFDQHGNCLDERSEKRLRGLATALLDYIQGAICPRIALEAMVREQAG